MRILYPANHDQVNSNDDEGAITHSLRILGHTVIRCSENSTLKYQEPADFALFHHPKHNALAVTTAKCPKVFWCFDLVEYPKDKSLIQRDTRRKNWVNSLIRSFDLGFFTDGDWVAADRTGKLVELKQGADERLLDQSPVTNLSDSWGTVHFSGDDVYSGVLRAKFVEKMFSTYKMGFNHIRNSYGEDLKKRIQGSIVVAPDNPVTDRYWSNRVYITTGFGGLLFHPYSERLARQFTDKEQIVFYHSIGDLHSKIRHYHERREESLRIINQAVQKTIREHTYTQRCQELVDTVKKRLL